MFDTETPFTLLLPPTGKRDSKLGKLKVVPEPPYEYPITAKRSAYVVVETDDPSHNKV
jgi:hypothetical protein